MDAIPSLRKRRRKQLRPKRWAMGRPGHQWLAFRDDEPKCVVRRGLKKEVYRRITAALHGIAAALQRIVFSLFKAVLPSRTAR